MITFYPGVGADEKTRQLTELVGEITATWALIEDSAFEVYVYALAGTILIENLWTYRAAFFSTNSFEQKLRTLNNVMKSQYKEEPSVLNTWAGLSKELGNASVIRNKIAHLHAAARSTQNETDPADVRLVPPFWKSMPEQDAFDKFGITYDQLIYDWAPYCGYHPRVSHPEAREQLAYRIGQFCLSLDRGRFPVNRS